MPVAAGNDMAGMPRFAYCCPAGYALPVSQNWIEFDPPVNVAPVWSR